MSITDELQYAIDQLEEATDQQDWEEVESATDKLNELCYRMIDVDPLMFGEFE